MSSIDLLASAAIVSNDVYTITKNASDMALAAGYSAFVQSVTGASPTVVKTADGRAQVILNQDQIVKMQGWLDSQVSGALTPAASKPKVEYVLGPVFTPWSLKYVVPAAIAAFVGGWVAHWIIAR